MLTAENIEIIRNSCGMVIKPLDNPDFWEVSPLFHSSTSEHIEALSSLVWIHHIKRQLFTYSINRGWRNKTGPLASLSHEGATTLTPVTPEFFHCNTRQ